MHIGRRWLRAGVPVAWGVTPADGVLERRTRASGAYSHVTLWAWAHTGPEDLRREAVEGRHGAQSCSCGDVGLGCPGNGTGRQTVLFGVGAVGGEGTLSWEVPAQEVTRAWRMWQYLGLAGLNETAVPTCPAFASAAVQQTCHRTCLHSHVTRLSTSYRPMTARARYRPTVSSNSGCTGKAETAACRHPACAQSTAGPASIPQHSPRSTRAHCAPQRKAHGLSRAALPPMETVRLHASCNATCQVAMPSPPGRHLPTADRAES